MGGTSPHRLDLHVEAHIIGKFPVFNEKISQIILHLVIFGKLLVSILGQSKKMSIQGGGGGGGGGLGGAQC